MPRFSERVGVREPVDGLLVVDAITDRLRNGIWNVIHSHFESVARRQGSGLTTLLGGLSREIAVELIHVPRDDARHDDVKSWLLQGPWHLAYEILELVVDRGFVAVGTADEVLELNGSGYRFTAGELIPITNREEIAALNEAVTTDPGSGPSLHIQAAIGLLGKKPEPDYRNATKEAISAVESLARGLTGEGNASRAFAALQDLLGLHGAFASGVRSLYAWTSDEDGIRHAILAEPNVGFAEAKYMVVACSAFVNFIRDRARSLGIKTS